VAMDEKWLSDWFYRLDQASRANAITELRAEQEKAVVDINRDLTEGIKQFSRLILQLWALKDAEGAVSPEELEQLYREARELEDRTRGLEDRLEAARKKFAAFEEMERIVNRMR
jgi:ubiquinone biosynthesis protein UbiJ